MKSWTIGLLSAAVPLALYMAYPSAMWNFDGVACAAALELGNPVYLFHAQHLLYAFFGFLFWKLLAPIGVIKALPALQMFTSLLAAGALYALWRLLYRLSNDAGLSLLVSCAAGVSAVYWVWSIEAQVYALGILGLAAATDELLSGRNPARTGRIGFYHGIAALGHVVHLLWIIPAFYWMRREKMPWRPYVAALASTVILPYALVSVFVLRPYHGQGAWLAHWLKGSLGLTADRSIGWHWPGITGPWQWLQATPSTLWGSLWPYGGVTVNALLKFLAGLTMIFLAGIIMATARRLVKQPVVLFSLLWLGVYGLFFSTWEPQTLCYRMSDLIPFSILLLTALMALPARRQRLWLGWFWMSSLLTINFYTRAAPMHDSLKNKLYAQTVMLAKITPDTSIYLTAGGAPWIYILYFTGRTAWNVHLLSLAEFDRQWTALKSRPPLYASSALVRDPQTALVLTRHRLKIISELPWLEVS